MTAVARVANHLAGLSGVVPCTLKLTGAVFAQALVPCLGLRVRRVHLMVGRRGLSAQAAFANHLISAGAPCLTA